MNLISKIIIPLFVVGIILYGAKRKVDVYNSFLTGAKEGLITSFNIFPAIIGMIFAINIFLNSGVINFILGWLSPVFQFLNVPLSILPMAILRPISGTASLAIMNDIFANFGPDSHMGRLASVIQGCTDTTIYVLALYFGSVKISKTRHALKCGLFADLMGLIMAFIFVALFFS